MWCVIGFDEGFGTALAKVTVNKEVPFGLRQISWSLIIYIVTVLLYNFLILIGYDVRMYCIIVFALNISYLSAVLLKQFIKQHWQEGEENFVHPAVSAGEKVSFWFTLFEIVGTNVGIWFSLLKFDHVLICYDPVIVLILYMQDVKLCLSW